MSTTTIRLSDELKARVETLAAQAGKTSHGFIVEAIARTVDEAEARQAFHAQARERLDEFRRTGMAMPWGEVRKYLLDKAARRPTRRPKARKLEL